MRQGLFVFLAIGDRQQSVISYQLLGEGSLVLG